VICDVKPEDVTHTDFDKTAIDEIATNDSKKGRQQSNLMNSRRPIRSLLPKPLNLIQSGEAAFSLENGLFFLKQYSCAGVIAGVFWPIATATLQSKL